MVSVQLNVTLCRELCRKSLIPLRDTTSHGKYVPDSITNDLSGYFQGNFVDEWVECWDSTRFPTKFATNRDRKSPEGGEAERPKLPAVAQWVIQSHPERLTTHEVFDKWFAEVVRERMEGRVFAVRFADDLVIGFTHRTDAQRVYRVIFQRFEKYGLKLHPEKTRLVAFGRPGSKGTDGQLLEEPEAFDFLGPTCRGAWASCFGTGWEEWFVISAKQRARSLPQHLGFQGFPAVGSWARFFAWRPVRWHEGCIRPTRYEIRTQCR